MLHLPVDRSQNAVHEPRRVRSAVIFRKLNGLIDRDARRHFVMIGIEQLVEADAQNIAVDNGDLFDRPIRRGFFQNIVDHREMLGDARKDPPRKIRLIDAGREFLKVPLEDRCNVLFLLIKIPLVERLEDDRSD